MSEGERGAIAVFALAVLGVLSIVTGAWLRAVVSERDAARLDGAAAQARALAQAGIEHALVWFADPESFAERRTLEAGTPCLSAVSSGDVFRKRCVDAQGLPSFRTINGASQFGGTLDHPAVLVQWEDGASLLRAPAILSAGFAEVDPVVRLELRVFAPTSPDAIAALICRATVGRSSAVVRAEVTNGPWRGATDAVFVGDATSHAVPLRVHWGGIAIGGAWDASGWLNRIPRRADSASVNGESYVTEPGIDRWASIVASGPILGPAVDGIRFAAPFEHLRQYADVHGIGLWGYQALKAYAKRHGRYYATRGTGLVYPDGGGSGISLASALAAPSLKRRFVFIDTIDGAPPRESNLDTLQATIDFVDVDAYVGTHLTITPDHGRAVVLDAPTAPESSAGPPLVRDVVIDGVHYRGVLVVAGQLGADTRIRLAGSLAALQGVRDPDAVEVWYDATLRSGYRSGFPAVVIKPGSRRVVADILG